MLWNALSGLYKLLRRLIFSLPPPGQVRIDVAESARQWNRMKTTQTCTTAASALDAVITANLTAAEAHFSGQAQQHNAEWKYAGDNRVPWVPLRADLNDLVEAA